MCDDRWKLRSYIVQMGDFLSKEYALGRSIGYE